MRAAGADDRVARADQHRGIGIDRPRAVLQLAGEAVVQALELGLLAPRSRSRSENSRHSPIDRSRTSGCSILLNQPMKLGQPAPRNAVGQQEVDVLLLRRLSRHRDAHCHRTVKPGDYDSLSRWIRTHDFRALRARRRRAHHIAGQAEEAASSCRKAKHRSLAGHVADGAPARRAGAVLRIRRARASSAADGAPDDVAARRASRASCGWPALYRERYRRRPCALTAEVARRHLRSAVHRRLPRAVPVQPLRAPSICRPARSCESSAGVTVTDLDGNRFYDLTGSYGVNVFGYDFYKELHRRAARERVRELGPVLGAYHPVVAYNVRAAARDLRPRRSVVPHVRHRGGDAGGAARALSHAPHATWCASAAPITAGGATCSRASAIRVPARETYTLNDMSEDALRVLRDAARHRLRAGQSAAGAASRTPTRRRDSALVDSGRARALRPRRPTPTGCGGCARSAPSAASC